MRIVELVVDELAEMLGFDGNSLVAEPAHQEEFFAFADENVEDLILTELIRQEMSKYVAIEDQHFAFAKEDERVVVGPLMVPDKKILRLDEEGNPYYVFFSKETIRTIAEGMMRDKMLDRLNVEHNQSSQVDGYMVSTWFVQDSKMDTSRAYGLPEYPVGTWVGMYKILDDKVWDKVKEGELRGFSIEGYFADKLPTN